MSMELCGKNASPVADGSSVYKGDKFRFMFLTSRLVRLEYDEDGRFEDRATQTVINRRFDRWCIGVRSEAVSSSLSLRIFS